MLMIASGLMARRSSVPVIRFENEVVAPSGERLKVLEMSLFEIVTEPFASLISDLNEEPSTSQSVFGVSFLEQNAVKKRIKIQGNALFILFFL
jgi:hypothetical protein